MRPVSSRVVTLRMSEGYDRRSAGRLDEYVRQSPDAGQDPVTDTSPDFPVTGSRPETNT